MVPKAKLNHHNSQLSWVATQRQVISDKANENGLLKSSHVWQRLWASSWSHLLQNVHISQAAGCQREDSERDPRGERDGRQRFRGCHFLSVACSVFINMCLALKALGKGGPVSYKTTVGWQRTRGWVLTNAWGRVEGTRGGAGRGGCTSCPERPYLNSFHKP